MVDSKQRRNFLLRLSAALTYFPAIGLFPSKLAAKGRFGWMGLFVEAVIAGAVSGYVAGRVAERGNVRYSIDAGWRSGDFVRAPRAFEALEYPSERAVKVPAGRYEVFGEDVRRISLSNSSDVELTCVVLKNHHSSRLVGVVYS